MTSTPPSEGDSLEGEVGDSEEKLAVGMAAGVLESIPSPLDERFCRR